METKYTLHKLPEEFIVTSNEEISKGDKVLLKDKVLDVLNFNENVLDIYLNKYGNSLSTCYNVTVGHFICFPESLKNKKVIAQQDQIDFSSLSEEEQKRIGWFDKVALSMEATKNQSFANGKHEEIVAQIYYRRGFQKAQELLSDRMFTLEDMEKAFIAGQFDGNDWYGGDVNQYLQSLSQPNSWEVEGEFIDNKFKITKIK